MLQYKVKWSDSTVHFVKMMNIYFGMKYDTVEELQKFKSTFNDMTSKLAIKISGVGGWLQWYYHVRIKEE